MAVAFDRLSPAARSFAQQAALGYLDRALPARSWMGVFSIDRGLSTLTPFTDDREALGRSLDRSTAGASSSFAGLRERDTIRNAYGGLATGFGQAHVAAAELAGAPECRAAEDEIIRRMEILESRLMESFQSLERDQQGFATAHALLALIGALEPLPGRKAILLFSEGLVIPADVEASFVTVVAAANRASVSIYGADAGGLRVASGGDETRRTIDSIQTRLRLQDDGEGNPLSRGGSARDPTTGLVLLERNEDTLRFDPGSGLGRLADQTGGFLIRDTNDLSTGLAEMSEDLSAYYLLSYTPRNEHYDGQFRTITVRLRRPHGRLQARKGYLAVRTALPVPALDYEAAALARLESGPPPTAVSLRLRALQFPEAPPLSVVPIMVEVPAKGLHDPTIVVLVRDASRRVIAKMSQRYALSGPAAPPDAAHLVLFYRETHRRTVRRRGRHHVDARGPFLRLGPPAREQPHARGKCAKAPRGREHGAESAEIRRHPALSQPGPSRAAGGGPDDDVLRDRVAGVAATGDRRQAGGRARRAHGLRHALDEPAAGRGWAHPAREQPAPGTLRARRLRAPPHAHRRQG